MSSPDQTFQVAIIGAGFCGRLVAVREIREQAQTLAGRLLAREVRTAAEPQRAGE